MLASMPVATAIDVLVRDVHGADELRACQLLQRRTWGITEDGYVNNPLFRFMARFFFGYASTLDSYMKSLGEKFGEQVTLQN